jgi:nanoRNase/pAp phosphatase (c-di-AMP/oligoRNAs hydrolase)
MMEVSKEKPHIVPVHVQQPVDKLRQVLEAHRGERHVVAIRGYPDPDSIASAMAHAHICTHFDIEPTVLYFDDISHQENRALVKKLSIDMVRYSPQIDISDYDRIAIVDTQQLDLPPEAERIPTISVVDHHRPQSDVDAEFVDVRDDAGSTWSMYTEYLSQG